jgi:hypothetical protein
MPSNGVRAVAGGAGLGVGWRRQPQKVGRASVRAEEGARLSGARCHGAVGAMRRLARRAKHGRDEDWGKGRRLTGGPREGVRWLMVGRGGDAGRVGLPGPACEERNVFGFLYSFFDEHRSRNKIQKNG